MTQKIRDDTVDCFSPEGDFKIAAGRLAFYRFFAVYATGIKIVKIDKRLPQLAVRRGRTESISKESKIIDFSAPADNSLEIIGDELVRNFIFKYFFGIRIHNSEAGNAGFLKVFFYKVDAEAVYRAYFCGGNEEHLPQKTVFRIF